MVTKITTVIAMLGCAGLAYVYISSYETWLELFFGVAFGVLALLNAVAFYRNEKKYLESIGFITLLVYITWGVIRFYSEKN